MYFIRLSSDGDYFKDEKSDGMYSSTLNIQEATRFASEAEAKQAYEDFGVKFMWRQAEVVMVVAYYELHS
jgi:hypothetical protein